MSTNLMSAYTDLHVHSSCSDGSDAPEEVVRRAASLGFSALAITDHDTVAGVLEGARAAERLGIQYLSGVEISSQFGKVEVHIVGLGIDPACDRLLQRLDTMRNARIARAKRIVERLQALGVPVVFDFEKDGSAYRGTIGRMHIARLIMDAGFASSIQEAFDKYLNPGRPAYFARERLSCQEAIDLIHEAGGLAFLAHPGIGNLSQYLDGLTRLPFDGLEAFHTKHSPGQVEQFRLLARELGWLVSGGSDCHGSAKSSPEMGKVRVPYEYYARIRECLSAKTVRGGTTSERF